jgi:hypothetical protein
MDREQPGELIDPFVEVAIELGEGKQGMLMDTGLLFGPSS